MSEHSTAIGRPIRIGNCSGFYGDRLSAMREMLEGGELDVLTGDYLAELTMLILGRDQLRAPSLGYARTFVRQAEDCLGLVVERGVRIVSNAGGLNPQSLAERLSEIATGLGLSPVVAWVGGDNLLPRAAQLGWDDALTANAYLGGFGIATALRAGADVVVTGRVADASLVVGPAVHHFGWSPTSYDELAGAVAAGHILECGTQATGGNFSGFLDLARDGTPLGFPLAEVAADGSAIITKHDGTGGIVSVDTVTAQLLYEVQSSRYLGPDVTLDLASIALVDAGTDRVRVSGALGEPPPARLKVCLNELGGWRNQTELVLAGMDVDAKADWVRCQLDARLQPRPASVEWTLGRLPEEDAATEEAASCLLRCTVKDAAAEVVGKGFSASVVELALASYPGFTLTAPPRAGTPYGIFRAKYVDREQVTEEVHVIGRDEVLTVAQPSVTADARGELVETIVTSAPASTTTRSLPLGSFVYARSGDKGGDANLGLWVRQGPRWQARVDWLLTMVTPGRIRDLVPEARLLEVEVYPLPNLGGVNVLMRGLLGDGVAASTRFDPQAKALGEWVRSRLVDIPEELL
ncbi:MAG: DUF1446 domain-containing protein [Actinomycetota bacterium]|nr:DUF1446 domain-containing protein [Actinomycetota bacterium]